MPEKILPYASHTIGLKIRLEHQRILVGTPSNQDFFLQILPLEDPLSPPALASLALDGF